MESPLRPDPRPPPANLIPSLACLSSSANLALMYQHHHIYSHAASSSASPSPSATITPAPAANDTLKQTFSTQTSASTFPPAASLVQQVVYQQSPLSAPVPPASATYNDRQQQLTPTNATTAAAFSCIPTSSSSSPSSSSTNTSTSNQASTPPKSRSSDARKIAAMHRATMACVHCRDAKHKCDGMPPKALLTPFSVITTIQQRDECQPVSAQKECSRCISHGLSCIWLPRAKLGRPLKKPRGSNPAAPLPIAKNKSNTSNSSMMVKTEAVPIFMSPTLSDNGNGTQRFTLPLDGNEAIHDNSSNSNSSSNNTFHSASASTMANVSEGAIEDALQSSIQHSYPKRHQQQQNYLRGGATQQRPSAGTHYWSSQTTAISSFAPSGVVPTPLITTDVSLQSSIRTGLKAYFAHGPRFCLAFIPAQETRFVNALDRWSGLLLNHQSQSRDMDSIPPEARDALTLAQLAAAIGWKLFRHDFSDSIHTSLLQAARQGLEDITSRDWATDQCTTNVQQLVYCFQSLLLGGTLEYGMDHVTRAGELFQKANSLVNTLELNRFDDAAGSSSSASPQGRLTATRMMDSPDLADDLRRIFWELCIIQVMYACSTTGDSSHCLLRPRSSSADEVPLSQTMRINFPDSNAFTESSDYGLRIRFASLLLESVHPTPVGTSRLLRMESLQRTLKNLSTHARHRFLTATSEQSFEIAYTATLMLNAAQIQLVRLTFFPNWNYSLSSCAFQVGRQQQHQRQQHQQQQSSFSSTSTGTSRGSSAQSCSSASSSSSCSSAATTPSPTNHRSLHTPLGADQQSQPPAQLQQPSSSSSSSSSRVMTLHWTKEAIRNAILEIVRCADDIIEIVELDNKPRWRCRSPTSWEPPQSGLLSHSPFHACPLVIGAFGHRAGATLYASLADDSRSQQADQQAGETNTDTTTTTSPEVKMEEHVGGGGHGMQDVLQEQYDDAVWRHQAILSNISVVHRFLLSSCNLWPVTGRLAAEVEECKNSEDHHDAPRGVVVEVAGPVLGQQYVVPHVGAPRDDYDGGGYSCYSQQRHEDYYQRPHQSIQQYQQPQQQDYDTRQQQQLLPEEQPLLVPSSQPSLQSSSFSWSWPQSQPQPRSEGQSGGQSGGEYGGYM
ncbi:unnamed protein product [Sympodiomycopsis kandeliae]